MNNIVTCKDARLETRDGEECLVLIAFQDATNDKADIDLANPGAIERIRDSLKTHGITFGTPAQPKECSVPTSYWSAPLRIMLQGENSRGRQMIVHSIEEYSLSSGSILFYFYTHEIPTDYCQFVGRTLELKEI